MKTKMTDGTKVKAVRSGINGAGQPVVLLGDGRWVNARFMETAPRVVSFGSETQAHGHQRWDAFTDAEGRAVLVRPVSRDRNGFLRPLPFVPVAQWVQENPEQAANAKTINAGNILVENF